MGQFIPVLVFSETILTATRTSLYVYILVSSETILAVERRTSFYILVFSETILDVERRRTGGPTAMDHTAGAISLGPDFFHINQP